MTPLQHRDRDINEIIRNSLVALFKALRVQWYLAWPTITGQVDRKKPPPRGFLFTMFPHQEPWVRGLLRRICTRSFEGGPLTHGSWWGTIVNRKPPRGGAFLSIRLFVCFGLFWFWVCYAATQLAIQLPQERIQVVRMFFCLFVCFVLSFSPSKTQPNRFLCFFLILFVIHAGSRINFSEHFPRLTFLKVSSRTRFQDLLYLIFKCHYFVSVGWIHLSPN